MKLFSKSRIKELSDILMEIALIPFQRKNIVPPFFNDLLSNRLLGTHGINRNGRAFEI